MDLYKESLHWSLGVITSAEPDDDQLRHALTRGDNMMFTSIAAGKARPRSRLGMILVNQTPYSNSSTTAGPAIVGGDVYPHRSGGTITHYTVLVMQNGDVHFLLDDGNSTNVVPVVTFSGALNPGLRVPSMATMNNRLFLIDGEGGKFSAKGTAEVNWGVEVPTGLALLSSGAGNMTGDYDILVTGWDSEISAESDRSEIVSITGLSNEQLEVTVNTVDAALTNRFFRIYIRKPSLGPGFYRVLSGTGFDSTQQAFPLNSASPSTTVTIDLTDTQINALTLTPPQIGSHGLPPSGAVAVALYERRLFVATEDDVYWSELDKPDAFNPISKEPIRSRDPKGGSVRGMAVHAGQLHIFTEHARVTLSGGADLRTWVWETDPTAGAVSARAIVVYDNWLYWWDESAGPVALGPDGQTLVFIGKELIREDVTTEAVNASRLWEVAAAAGNGRVLFAVPEFGQTRLTKMLSFHAELKRWESTRWDPMDPSVIFNSFNTNRNQILYLGNYNGQLFRMLKGGNDGVRAGTMRGTFVAGASSVTSISDLSASFDISGAGLIERKVTILDSSGIPVTGTNRPRIVSNTATTFTMNDTVSGLTVGETYTYLIGGPDFILESFWDHMDLPFTRKRFDRAFFEFRSDSGAAEVNVAVAVNFDDSLTRDTNVQEQLDDASAGLWDQADWDAFFWDSPNEVAYSLPVIKSGRNYRLQIRSPYPNQGFTLLKLAMLGWARGDRFRRAY